MIYLCLPTMFFILSKILDFLLNPLTWILAGMVCSLVVTSPKLKKRWLMITIFTAIFFTNPFIINKIFHAWESDPYASDTITVPFDAAIVLGGSLRYYDEATKRPVYSLSVDRLMQAIALYKSGKVKQLILSGGSGMVLQPDEKESVILYKVLMESGIPSGAVLLENESRNTHENAVYTAALIRNHFKTDSRFLLITSAFHMRRSLACFNKTGLEITPFPVDEKAGSRPLSPDNTIVPDAQCLVSWDMLMHEWFGILTYRFAGYI